MQRRLTFLCVLISLFLFSNQLFAESDPIYERCVNQKTDPAPWCYEAQVERIGDPDLCENILKYWSKADGVHGWCFYRLAVKKKDCSLCNRIKKQDIRKMCIRDVCKPGE
jgi:hypothetical protein